MIVLGALIFHLPSAALAAPPAPDAKALHAEGLEAFKGGRFAEAGEAFMRAQALDPSASLLWNAARSFDKAGDISRARSAYFAYIAHSDAGADKRTKAATWLREHPEAPTSDARTAENETSTAANPLIVRRANDAGKQHVGLGWTLVSLGAAATIGGTVAMLVAQGSKDEADALTWGHAYEATLVQHRSLTSAAEQQELAGWLTYGAAVGLVTTGLFLLLKGPGGGAEAPAGMSAIHVSPTPGGLSATGMWRF